MIKPERSILTILIGILCLLAYVLANGEPHDGDNEWSSYCSDQGFRRSDDGLVTTPDVGQESIGKNSINGSELVDYLQCLKVRLNGQKQVVSNDGWLLLLVQEPSVNVTQKAMSECNYNVSSGHKAGSYIQVTNTPADYKVISRRGSYEGDQLPEDVKPYFGVQKTSDYRPISKRINPNLTLRQLAYNFAALNMCSLWCNSCISRSCPYYIAELTVHVNNIHHGTVWLHHFCRNASPQGGNLYSTLTISHKDTAYYVGTGWWKVRSTAATTNDVAGDWYPASWNQYWCGPHY
uniref:p1M2 beta peptide, KP1 killer toxin n=1 Tax=Ustilago maydis virus TaxID=47930 RepID=Q90129_9VIRU|nr:killer toxin KP1 precursor - Ustilago maydis virus P1 [Ustilago maydis virus P1]AAB39279.1 P1M2 beta peptide, KP1 killer toxin [Ustilago maydis virus]